LEENRKLRPSLDITAFDPRRTSEGVVEDFGTHDENSISGISRSAANRAPS
jgi:hypothetical protein